MTRRTFSLLVCRTIGVFGLLSILSMVRTCALVYPGIKAGADNRIDAHPQGLAFLGFAIAIGVPAAALAGGILARQISEKASGIEPVDVLDPQRSSLALATSIGFLLLGRQCNQLAVDALAGILLGPSAADRSFVRLLMHADVTRIGPGLVELALNLAAIAAIIAFALRKVRLEVVQPWPIA